jgi:hypothetical protein
MTAEISTVKECKHQNWVLNFLVGTVRPPDKNSRFIINLVKLLQPDLAIANPPTYSRARTDAEPETIQKKKKD